MGEGQLIFRKIKGVAVFGELLKENETENEEGTALAIGRRRWLCTGFLLTTTIYSDSLDGICISVRIRLSDGKTGLS